MSQAKVDRQKEYKKNRKEIMPTRNRRRCWAGSPVVCVSRRSPAARIIRLSLDECDPEPDASTFYNLTATDGSGILNPFMSNNEYERLLH